MNPASSIESGAYVKVCIRIRPANAKERQLHNKSCIRVSRPVSSGHLSSSSQNSFPKPNVGAQQVIVGKDRSFTFDTILGVQSSQREVYDQCVQPLVTGFIEGYNATVLAYGQTGTGKTFTMAGVDLDGPENNSLSEQHGIIPRVIHDIFRALEAKNASESDFKLGVEYIEIYNEELRDLLHPETSTKQITIREDGEGRIIVAGAKFQEARTKEAVLRYFTIGSASRSTGCTLMNEHSSRSHAIFSLILKQRDTHTSEYKYAKFHLVDLAGSERAKRTGAVAGRFKESVCINQGLLALGNVISSLSDEKKVRIHGQGNHVVVGHIPYRDSKLTRMLQDSLGGNSKTLMIACVSPATRNFEETLNTLKYANRAKNIKNRPVVNQHILEKSSDSFKNDEEVLRMRGEIADLRMQLKQQNPKSLTSRVRHSVHEDDIDDTNWKEQYAQLKTCHHSILDSLGSIRSYSIEAATAMVSMEKEIKPLGRPAQKRLNEIVKILNNAIQVSNAANKIGMLVSEKHDDNQNSKDDMFSSRGSIDREHFSRLKRELEAAKSDLERDEEIFEMKNGEIKKLQLVVLDAKKKNNSLIQRVQYLENVNVSSRDCKASVCFATNENAEGVEENNISTRKKSRNSMDSASSRGLFTPRIASDFDNYTEDDQVLTGQDEIMKRHSTKVHSSLFMPEHKRTENITRRATSAAPQSSESLQEKALRLEKSNKLLRKRLEQIESEHTHLLAEHEGTTNQWQLDREQFEKQMTDLRQKVQGHEHQEVSLRHRNYKDTESKHQSTTLTTEKNTSIEITIDDEDINDRADAKSESEESHTDTQIVLKLFDLCLQHLASVQQAKEDVVHLIEDKLEAEDSMTKAARRKSAIEMHQLRNSLSIKESINELSLSVDKIEMQLKAEHKEVEELARLTKLKKRAERKLVKLRIREEQKQFLDTDAQQELVDVEELIEDLNSHIAYQDAELMNARKELLHARTLKNSNSLTSLIEKVCNALRPARADVAMAFIRRAFKEITKLSQQISTTVNHVAILEQAVMERDVARQQLEYGFAAARIEHDRLLREQIDALQLCKNRESDLCRQLSEMLREKEHHAGAVKSSSSKGEQEKDITAREKEAYTADLEKHVVFYKSKAKQLQEQLQEWLHCKTGHKAKKLDQPESELHARLHQRIQQLECSNNELTKNLATANILLRNTSLNDVSKAVSASGTAHVIRVSPSQLREIHPRVLQLLNDGNLQ